MWTLRWRRNGHDGVWNHQPHHRLLKRLFGCRSKKTSKLSVTGLCTGNSPGTGEFPAQMASNAENVCIWWRHHGRNTATVIIRSELFPLIHESIGPALALYFYFGHNFLYTLAILPHFVLGFSLIERFCWIVVWNNHIFIYWTLKQCNKSIFISSHIHYRGPFKTQFENLGGIWVNSSHEHHHLCHLN